MPLTLRTAAAVLLAAVAVAAPASAWAPETQVAIAELAARLAPPDLARQIDEHRRELREGALLPFRDPDPARHGHGVEAAVLAEAERAVELIRAHHPFADIVRQMGVLSHFLADANNPLRPSDADPAERTYYADFLAYVDSADERFAVVFYGLEALAGPEDLAALVRRAGERGRGLYPLVGREYRRIRAPDARVRRFDDRSTAFAVANLAFNHAVTDAALALRYVWLRAGGGDERTYLPQRGDPLRVLVRRGGGPAGAKGR